MYSLFLGSVMNINISSTFFEQLTGGSNLSSFGLGGLKKSLVFVENTAWLYISAIVIELYV
jgi:hypothetical protein